MSVLSILAIFVSIIGSSFSLASSFTKASRRRPVVMNLTYRMSDGTSGSVEGVTVPESFANAIIKKLKRAQRKRQALNIPSPGTA
jgi:hypothetical protein